MRKNYTRLERIVARIILFTFVWLTYTPGFALAAEKSKGARHKYRAIVQTDPGKTDKLELEVQKEKARVLKEQAKHKAASEVLKKEKNEKQKSASPKKGDEDIYKVKLILLMEDGKSIVHEFPEPSQGAKPQSESSLAATQSTPGPEPSEGLYRAVRYWQGSNDWLYIDVTPTEVDPDGSRCYTAGFLDDQHHEDNLCELIYRKTSADIQNPANYFIQSHACKRPWTTYESAYIARWVYKSWLDEDNNKKSQYWDYWHNLYTGDIDIVYDSGVLDHWYSSSTFGSGIYVLGQDDVGSWGYRTYTGYNSNNMELYPGGQIESEYSFLARGFELEGEGICEPFARSLKSSQIKFKISYPPDNWDPGTATYKVRIKDGDTVKRTIDGSLTGDKKEVKCEWDGKDDNGNLLGLGRYKVQAMVTSETEYAKTINSDDDTVYLRTAWLDIGSVRVMSSEKGLGWQFLNRFEPVNVSSGNYFLETQDLFIPARAIPFTVKRYHNSMNASLPGYFGYGWSSNISPYLTVLETGNVKIMNPDGEYNLYTKNPDGTYTSMPGVFSKLVKNTDGTYVLIHKDKSKTKFNTRGQLAWLKDPNANTITFSYDSTNKLTRLTDSASRSIGFEYDDVPRITKITDFAGRNTLYEYDSNGHLTKYTDPMGYSNWYSYNSDHQILTIWDSLWWPVVTNTYDDTTGRVTSQVTADNTSFSYSYNTTSRTATMTTGSQTFNYYYDDKDNLTKEENPLGAATIYAYDENRNMIAVTDPLSHTTSYEYDQNANRTKITDAQGNVATTTYNLSFNKPTQITTALSQVTKFRYDTKGNLTKTIDPLNKSTLMEYDQYGQLIKTTDPLTRVTSYQYDSYGNMISSTNPLSKTTTFAYDSVGNMTRITDPLSHSTTKSYNSNNWLTSVTDPLNNTTTFAYDYRGNLANTEDALHRRTNYFHDELSRLWKVEDSMMNSTQYFYDSYGNMRKMTDARNKDTVYEYDLANRLTKVSDPLSRATSFEFDAAGNMTSRSDAKGQTISYSYDSLNRLTSKGGASSVSYGYDAVGRRTFLTDSTGNSTYTYDLANRLKTVTSPGTKTIAYAYNAVGALTKLTDAEAVNTIYSYDSANRLTQAKRGTRIMTYGYDDANRPTNKTYPNAVQGQFSYDNANRLTSITYQTGGNPFWNCSYGYDAVGNRTSKVAGDTYTYFYDPLDRLQGVQKNGNPDSMYNFDAVGNRTTKTTPQGQISYTYDDANQMLSATSPTGTTSYAYDNNGNMTSKTAAGKTTKFEFDAEDRLTKIDYPGTAENLFSYNGDGLRVYAKRKNGTITRYVWSGSDVVNEYDDTWAIKKSYYLGASLEGQFNLKTGAPKYYHGDGLGSVMKLTDNAGTVTDSYDYDEYGVQTLKEGKTANVYRYTGQQFDDDADTIYLRARYYDPETGRFITRDPKKGNLENPERFNAYVYCNNNPLIFVDPNGLDLRIWVDPAIKEEYDINWARVASTLGQASGERVVYIEKQEYIGADGKGNYVLWVQYKNDTGLYRGASGMTIKGNWKAGLNKPGLQKSIKTAKKKYCATQEHITNLLTNFTLHELGLALNLAEQQSDPNNLMYGPEVNPMWLYTLYEKDPNKPDYLFSPDQIQSIRDFLGK